MPDGEHRVIAYRPTSERGVALIGIAVSVGLAVAAGVPAEALTTGVILGMFLLSLWLVTSLGTTIVSPEEIVHQTMLDRYRLAWDEVDRVAVDPLGQALVLRSGDRQLATFGPAFWRDDRAAALVDEQLEARGLVLSEDPRAAYRSCHGTRVPWPEWRGRPRR